MGDEGKAVGWLSADGFAVWARAQYKISKTKLSISIIAITPATDSTNVSLASW